MVLYLNVNDDVYLGTYLYVIYKFNIVINQLN